jgi:hypothetical protein
VRSWTRGTMIPVDTMDLGWFEKVANWNTWLTLVDWSFAQIQITKRTQAHDLLKIQATLPWPTTRHPPLIPSPLNPMASPGHTTRCLIYL